MPVVALPGALEYRLRILSDRGDPAFLIDDADDAEGGDADAAAAGHGHGGEGLRVGVQVLLEAVDDLEWKMIQSA